MKNSTGLIVGLGIVAAAAGVFFLGKSQAKASILPKQVLTPELIPVSPNNRPATVKPALPPGTSSVVVRAIEEAWNNGTLTEGQAEAVEQLYAPMYYTEGGYEIPGGVNPETGEVHGPATVVDFGSEEAARAALEAYMDNFV